MVKKIRLRVVQTAIILIGILLVTTSASATSQNLKGTSVYDQAPWLITSADLPAPEDLPVISRGPFHHPVSYMQNAASEPTTRFVGNPTLLPVSTDFCFEN